MSARELPREDNLAWQLSELLRAGAPIVVVNSWEEDCVERVTRKATRLLEKKLFIWSATRGFHSGIDDENPVESFPDPYEALLRLRREVNSVGLLKDFHRFWDNHRCVRGLRDMSLEPPGQAAQVVLSMPFTTVPEELAKDVAFMDVPLPDGEELKTLIAAAMEETGKTLPPEDAERASVAAAGLTQAQALRVFRLAAEHLPDNIGGFFSTILNEKRSLARQALALEFMEPTITFDSVGGLELLKKWLNSRAAAFTSRAREYGLPQPKGLLLLGVQGCGKSISAKSVAQLWKLPLLRLDLSRIDPVSGESMLMQALHTAQAVSPAVLWVDEIEKGFGTTDGERGGVSLRSLSAFVTWLQEKTSPVYVVATANSISRMPPELLRKGRFDDIFFVDLPSQSEREEVFRIHLTLRGRKAERYDLKQLASESEGFSGAEIEAVVISGMFEAFSQEREVNDDDILYSIRTTIPLSTTMEDEIKQLRDWARGRARPASLDTRLADLLSAPKGEE